MNLRVELRSGLLLSPIAWRPWRLGGSITRNQPPRSPSIRKKQQTRPQFHMQAHSSKQQLYKISALSVFSMDKKIGCSRDAVPASRRRSISPPTQLRKADLGTWHSDRSFRFAVRVKSVSRPCKVRVGCGRSVRAKSFRVFSLLIKVIQLMICLPTSRSQNRMIASNISMIFMTME